VTGCGIRQFIDIGTGLPADGNVHEVADRHPDAAAVQEIYQETTTSARPRSLRREH
jgi:hypothetical protein